MMMFYNRFVWWLTHKVNRWQVKKNYGDTGLYNHFDDMHKRGLQPFVGLIPFIFYVGPFAAYLYFVMEVLPFSNTVRTLIVGGSLGGAWIWGVIYLVRRIKKEKQR
ncbi:MAG TPA: hypothetical protein VF733_05140 [Candidatus Saccharimonadales bacterium]